MSDKDSNNSQDITLIGAYNAVCHEDSGLTTNERFVVMVLANHQRDKTNAWPSISRISRVTGMSERTVMRVVRSLEGRGVILRETRRGVATRYRVQLNQCQSVTSDTESPVTQGHQCQSVTSDTESPTSDSLSGVPVTLCHLTSDSLSPEEIKKRSRRDQEGDQNVLEPVSAPNEAQDEHRTDPPASAGSGSPGSDGTENKSSSPARRKRKTVVERARELGFDDWYENQWPGRKVGRLKAAEAWLKLTNEQRLACLELTGLYTNNYNLAEQQQSQLPENKRFLPSMPMPATFLNQQRWTDDHRIKPPRSGGGVTNSVGPGRFAPPPGANYEAPDLYDDTGEPWDREPS